MKTKSGILISHIGIVALVLLTLVEAEVEKAVAFKGGEITLKCRGNITETDSVEWRDNVYNIQRTPILIYSSNTGVINQDHVNKDYLSVTDNELTITGLKSTDVGLYICTITHANDAAKEVHEYQLDLLSKPECTPKKVDTTEGQSFNLRCSSDVVGDFPPMVWRNSRGDVPNQMDKSEIFQASKEVDVVTGYMDDKDTYECAVTISRDGKVTEEICSVPFAVTYKAQKVMVTPDKEFYEPGDIMTFSAIGNPTPTLTLDPQGKTNADGSIQIEVTEEMLNQDYTYTFTAENSLTAEPVVFTKAFRVIKPTTPPPPTEKEDNGDNVLATDSSTKKGGVPVLIIGVVVGVIVLIILVILIVIIIRRKKSNKPKGAKQVPTSDDQEKGKGVVLLRNTKVENSDIEKQPINGNSKGDENEDVWMKRNSYR